MKVMERTGSGPLMTELVRIPVLRKAWDVVAANDAADGTVSASVERFAERLDERLTELSAQLRDGAFDPHPLRRVELDRRGDSPRVLHIPSVRDRVVERALVDVLTSRIDPWLSPHSFAYRPGLGVADACQALVRSRDAGMNVVVRLDVADCFDSLDRDILIASLARRVPEVAILTLVNALLERPRLDGRRLRRSARGAPQGGPLSPLLCNVYLDRFDTELARHGVAVIRYADDIALPCSGAIRAWEVMEMATDSARTLGLELGDDKASVTTFDEGFAFLGEDFTAIYPPEEPLARVREPDRRVLYVQAEGSLVRISKGQVVVSKHDNDLLSVPSSHVGAVVCIGSANVSAGFRSKALGEGIDVVFISRRGRFDGWLQGARLPNARTRRLQYERSGDTEFRLSLARLLVVGKLANQRALLLRYQRREGSDRVVEAAEAIERQARQAERVATIDELMGAEGAGSLAYFSVFAQLLPPWTQWTGRNRNPPKDPANAALSFAYTLLTGEAVAACAVAGLDPVAGFLHGDHGDRPSLALDLMEEFRPVIADTVVMDLLRRNQLQPGHFRSEADRPGVLLTDKGRRLLIGRFEERMLTVFTHVATRKRVAYRRGIYLQAARIAGCIGSGEVRYTPVAWR